MDLLRGTVIVVLVAGLWYLLAAIRDPAYIWTFLWDHNVARYFTTEPGVKHPEPVYYFLPVLTGGYLPWSLFLPSLSMTSGCAARSRIVRRPCSCLFGP